METEKVKKLRNRKANFSTDETRVLIEEVNVEHMIFFSSLSATVTNGEKNAIWNRITSKVNGFGVAKREVKDVREKWRAMKGAVLSRQRLTKKTGGGPPPDPVPFEDIILGILGAGTTLVSGINFGGNYISFA